jgi:hypothetical protein
LDEENAAYYEHVRDLEKKTQKQAMVDLMRKQLRRLVAVLGNGRPFKKTRPAHSQTLPKPLARRAKTLRAPLDQ